MTNEKNKRVVLNLSLEQAKTMVNYINMESIEELERENPEILKILSRLQKTIKKHEVQE